MLDNNLIDVIKNKKQLIIMIECFYLLQVQVNNFLINVT